MTDLFDNKPNVDPIPTAPVVDLPQGGHFLDALVGDGKKFADVEALAHGKTESDLYIKQLQSENANMRSKISEQESVADMLDKALERQDTITSVEPIDVVSAPPNDSASQSALSQVDIQKLVDAQVNSRLNEQDKMANVQSVHDAAKAAFGDDYRTVLSDKAKTLGIGQDFLAGIAADQPAAFLKLMINDQETPSSTHQDLSSGIPAPSTFAELPQVSSEKNYAHYSDLRKTMKASEYFSPKVQNEIFAAAKEQGEKFYS